MATIPVNDESFQDVVKKDKLVLVDFYADWCGPCKQLSPILDEVSNDFAGKVTVAKANIDDSENSAQQYGIRGIPTMILFKDGKQVAMKVGVINKAQITEWLKANA
jgi:thioredoxin 1